jgi:hypothetical protein
MKSWSLYIREIDWILRMFKLLVFIYAFTLQVSGNYSCYANVYQDTLSW